jgi:hypothetical protein
MWRTVVEQGLMNHPDILGPLEFATENNYLTDEEATLVALAAVAGVRETQGIDDHLDVPELEKLMAPIAPKFDRAYAAWERQQGVNESKTVNMSFNISFSVK